jgi:hypothetical protein
MVTTAMTLPLFIVILFGIWYLFWWLMVKQQLHYGVGEAARQATELGRYWNIDPTGQSDISGRGLMPADYYEIEARRVIETRLRDISNFSSPTLKNALVVRVEEPLLAFAPGAAPPISEGYIDSMCDPKAVDPGQYRATDNIRLRIYAELNLPLMPVRIPYMDPITVTLRDRAIGYVQCPRWRGKRDLTTTDQSEKLGQEAPYMQYRFPSTPSYPTITPSPPTETPTTAPTETATAPAPPGP